MKTSAPSHMISPTYSVNDCRLSAIISPNLGKFMKHNKSNTTFLHEIVITPSPIYLSKVTYVISSFNLTTKLYELIPNAIISP